MKNHTTPYAAAVPYPTAPARKRATIPAYPDPQPRHTAPRMPDLPDLSALEGQLRNLTAQIETLRQPKPATDHILKALRRDLSEIATRLTEAMPNRTVEALEADVATLSERIDASRTVGIDPQIIAPIEHSLGEVRSALHRVRPAESLAGFNAAIRTLSDRIDQAGDGERQDSASLVHLEGAIRALRNVVTFATSQEPLGALSEEVRRLSGKLDHVINPHSAEADIARPAEPKPTGELFPGTIERSLQEINTRLSALQVGPDQARHAASGDYAKRGLVTAQDSLEAAHATLTQLVDQVAKTLGGVREARLATEAGQAPAVNPAMPQFPYFGTPAVKWPSPPESPSTPEAYMLAAQAWSQAMTGQRDRQPPDIRTQPDFSAGRFPFMAVAAEQASRPMSQPMKSLILGAAIILLAVVAARISLQIPDISSLTITKSQASSQVSANMLEQAQSGNQITAAAPEIPALTRSQTPEPFHVPSSTATDRQTPRDLMAMAEPETAGAIGRPVTVAVGPREAARERVLPLPDSLPANLRAEAAKGKPAAEYEVGVRLVEGNGVTANTQEGLRWLKRAAASGLAPAHLWIGSLYERGVGVEKSPNLARTHYAAAAEKGNAKAMHNLAVLYAEGIDGRRDYKTAARWFERAAERGIADSQYNLGVLLARGIGVNRNAVESYKWLALAALQGDRDAARHRDEVGQSLDPASLASARTAVQTFTARPQPDDAVTVSAPAGGWDTERPARKQRAS